MTGRWHLKFEAVKEYVPLQSTKARSVELIAHSKAKAARQSDTTETRIGTSGDFLESAKFVPNA